MKFDLIAQHTHEDLVFDKIFGEAVNFPDLDRLDVAVAYATTSGIPKLSSAIGRAVPLSRWIIGIDDAVSQPSAIEQIKNTPGAKVRLATQGPKYRFHPKIYQLWSSSIPEICVSYVGSGNLTSNGLKGNAEAGIVLSSENSQETAILRKQWKTFWDLGNNLTPTGLERYKEVYDSARATRAASAKALKDNVLDSDTITSIMAAMPKIQFDGTPQSAEFAWLECGSASAGGRDLEFPAKMIPFFGLKGTAATNTFEMKENEIFKLDFTMRLDNGMWRLLLSRNSIFAAIGRENLRPIIGGNRSDLVIIFQKLFGDKADYHVQFATIGSDDYDKLLQETKTSGKLNRTNGAGGRHFGYY